MSERRELDNRQKMERAKRPSISVFFPAFNDEKTIGPLVKEAFAVLPTLTDDYEVIIVDDGSSDSTAETLDELARRFSGLRIVRHERNRGYGAALQSGFAHARKELVFYTDGDGQYDVREIVELHRLMTERIDVVNGYKIARADGRLRAWLGRTYNYIAHLLFHLPIRDVDCDFRLIRRAAIRKIALASTSGAICVELIHKLASAGCVFAEVPVHHYPRAHGRSQFFTLRRVARTIFDLVALRLKLTARKGSGHRTARDRAAKERALDDGVRSVLRR